MRVTFGDVLGDATGEACGLAAAADAIVPVLASGDAAGVAAAWELVPCAFAMNALASGSPIVRMSVKKKELVVFFFIVFFRDHGLVAKLCLGMELASMMEKVSVAGVQGAPTFLVRLPTSDRLLSQFGFQVNDSG
jgi:hypothetical protein